MNGTHTRVLTAPVGGGFAVQFGRSLEPADSVLARLRLILLFVVFGGVALAVALGRLVSRNVVAPIVHVTDAARHIAATEDLGRRIEVETHDEVGELAEHFNAMLDTLERIGRRAAAIGRGRLARAPHPDHVAAHQHRGARRVRGPAARRARPAAAPTSRSRPTELGMLVADLIELARGDEPSQEREDIRLDDLVREAVTRAKRHAPSIDFRAELEPAVLDGTRERLSRAVNNLLDNAAKHSPPGGIVEVHAGPSGVSVRDHGTGVDPEDLPHLFDRFYRGASSRGRPGSGLGLAIVRQVAEQHGGTVRATNTPTGGAEFTLALPATAPPPSPSGEPKEIKGLTPLGSRGARNGRRAAYARHASTTSSRTRRRHPSRVLARRRASSRSSSTTSIAAVSLVACPRHPPHGLAVPDVLPDGQPHAPAHRDAAAESRPRHAASSRDVRPSVQPSARGRRPRLRASFQLEERPHRPAAAGSRLRYIARNPVEAGLCSRPEAWPWSSHAADRPSDTPSWLDDRRLLSYFAQDGGDALRAYSSSSPRSQQT